MPCAVAVYVVMNCTNYRPAFFLLLLQFAKKVSTLKLGLVNSLHLKLLMSG